MNAFGLFSYCGGGGFRDDKNRSSADALLASARSLDESLQQRDETTTVPDDEISLSSASSASSTTLGGKSIPVLMEVVGAMWLSRLLVSKNNANKKHEDDSETEEDDDEPELGATSNRDLKGKKKKKGNKGKTVDPYCRILILKKSQDGRYGYTEVHRTKTFKDDEHPIWTVDSKSLCLFSVDPDDVSTSLLHIEICHRSTTLGVVTMPLYALIPACLNGERYEYEVRPMLSKKQKEDGPDGLAKTQVTCTDSAILACRFRKASREDCKFIKKYQKDDFDRGRNLFRDERNVKATHQRENSRIASDIEFRRVFHKNMFTSYRKRDPVSKETLYRVMPYPDPHRPEATTWMTKQQLKQCAMEPSRIWHHGGDQINSESLGELYVEILGCDNLPNLDMGPDDLTDPFVGIVFEETMVRTSVLQDTLHPRWMPWSDRAFCFSVHHPCSLLFLGVFDHDEFTSHDPVGRVVISLADFLQSHTQNLLQFKLRHDPNDPDDYRGTLTVRITLCWNDMVQLREAVSKPIPQFLINVNTDKSFHVLRYMTRGEVDMLTSSLTGLQLYYQELKTHWRDYCYIYDVLINVWLWRGRIQVGDNTIIGRLFGKKTVTLLPNQKVTTIWFPIHSVVLFLAVVAAVERPAWIPTLLSYIIAYILLCLHYHASHHPNPWKRVRPLVWFREDKLPPATPIRAYEGVLKDEALQALDRIKADRMTTFLSDFFDIAYKIYCVYNRTSFQAISLQTVPANWSMPNPFYYLQYYPFTFFRILCKYIRLFRGVVTWKHVTYTHGLVISLLWLGTICWILPMQFILIWTFRILAWTLLGPWIKALDVAYFQTFFKTREDLLQAWHAACRKYKKEHGDRKRVDRDIVLEHFFPKNKILDERVIFRQEWLREMEREGRLVTEETWKLKDVRSCVFGKYAEPVPPMDYSTRDIDYPLPTSTAVILEENENQQDGKSNHQQQDEKSNHQNRSVPSASKAIPRDVLAQIRWNTIPGQKLYGHMIPRPKSHDEEDDVVQQF